MARLFVDYNKLNDKERKEYNESLKLLYILLGFATVLFYVIPYLFMFLGEFGTMLINLSILYVFTAFCFMAGLMHSRRYGFGVFVPLALAIFFMPTVVIFYKNISLVGLSLLYLMLGMFGEFTGYQFLRRKKSKRQPFGLNRLINGRSEKKDRGGKQTTPKKDKSDTQTTQKKNKGGTPTAQKRDKGSTQTTRKKHNK